MSIDYSVYVGPYLSIDAGDETDELARMINERTKEALTRNDGVSCTVPAYMIRNIEQKREMSFERHGENEPTAISDMDVETEKEAFFIEFDTLIKELQETCTVVVAWGVIPCWH